MAKKNENDLNSIKDDDMFASYIGTNDDIFIEDVTSLSNEILENENNEDFDIFSNSDTFEKKVETKEIIEEETIITKDKEKNKKKKFKKIEFLREDQQKTEEELERLEEEKEEEELKNKNPYDLLIEGLENILARIQDNEVAEIICFSKNMRPLFSYNKTKLLLTQCKVLNKGDIVLHIKPYEDYAIRRYIKTKNDKIYLLGDSEKKYTIVERKHIIAKISSMINNTKYKSFNKKHKSFYKWRKTHNLLLRTLNREFHTITEDEYLINYHIQANEEALKAKPKILESFVPDQLKDTVAVFEREMDERKKAQTSNIDVSDLDDTPSVDFNDIMNEKIHSNPELSDLKKKRANDVYTPQTPNINEEIDDFTFDNASNNEINNQQIENVDDIFQESTVDFSSE